jgi:hypothetical protein
MKWIRRIVATVVKVRDGSTDTASGGLAYAVSGDPVLALCINTVRSKHLAGSTPF